MSLSQKGKEGEGNIKSKSCFRNENFIDFLTIHFLKI